MLLHFYSVVIHRRAKFAVVHSIVRTSSLVKTLSNSSFKNSGQGGGRVSPTENTDGQDLPGAPNETLTKDGSLST